MTELEAQIPGAVNYNIAVQETDEGIVFLRKIVKGGTDKSYGIHVARLAGLPPAVIKRAHERLHSLEKQAGRTPTKPAAKQMDFFESPVVSELKKLDPHAITPLQALQKLSEWKAKL